LKQASELEGFADVVHALDVGEGTLDSIARAMLSVFASTRDFTALHAVTSTHALRVLLPWFPDRDLALRYHAQALVAAYVRMNAPRIDARFDAEAPSWETIDTRAIASEDDHDAKFVYSCSQEQAARGDALYRRAAALRLRLA
jgi:hypothetical protein